MTTINDAALLILLESPRGALVQDIELRANAAATALQNRINEIIDNPMVQPNADFVMVGNRAIIGIVDPFLQSNSLKNVSEYMDEKLGIRENWWTAVGEQAARL